MPLNITKRNIKRRRKNIAIATAQVLYKLGLSDSDINMPNDVIRALGTAHGTFSTEYGKAAPEDLIPLIESEGLDMEEVKRRLAKYREVELRRLKEAEREEFEEFVDTVSNALMYMGVENVRDINEVIEYYSKAAVELEIPDVKKIVKYIKKVSDKEQLVNSINKKLAKMQHEEKIASELQDFLDKMYSEYKIGGTVKDIEYYYDGGFDIMAEVGTEPVFQRFSSVKEAKDKIIKIVESERKKIVKCTRCSRPYTLYSLVNGDVVKCSCGALVRVTEGESGYSVKFMLHAPQEPIPGYSEFINEIGRHIYNKGILTYSFASESQKWDVKRVDGMLFFGVNAVQNSSFPDLFASLLKSNGFGAVVLRSFTNKKDVLTGYIIKELRGYRIKLVDGRLSFEQISAREMAIANTTDSITGNPLPIERSVVYCGPGNDFLDERFNIIKWPVESN